MKPETVTVTLTLEQAEALVNAATCLSVAADGDIADLINIYTPGKTPDARDADTYKTHIAFLAIMAGAVLREAIEAADKRNPELQDFLHQIKMMRKRNVFDKR